jgi:flagellar protein FlgJ
MAAIPTPGLNSLASLRQTAGSDPKAAVKEAAKQFETLFMQELMKSMRETTMSSGLFDNSATKLGTEMLDAQYATQMSGRAGGLGDMLARQLDRQLSEPLANMAGDVARQAGKNELRTPPPGKERQVEFLRTHDDAAKAAEEATGIPASFMIAQAAHESGWGRREIRHADGSNSFNLFGIKAGPNWQGPVATITTTEYINGQPRKVTAKFRAYSSYEESFKDYASLMKNSPRYSKVVANADTAQDFARGLQKAGYATDPAYAQKLTKMINQTLRLQRTFT